MDIKTINLPTTSNYNSNCCGYNFIISTPSGADYITCPICSNLIESYDDFGIDDDNYDYPSYCNKCKILFNIGCKHAENGCTDSTFFAEFIESFEYNGIKYDNMPLIESIEDYAKLYKDFKFNWICSHPPHSEDVKCLKAFYKDEKYYNICDKNNKLNLLRGEIKQMK